MQCPNKPIHELKNSYCVSWDAVHIFIWPYHSRDCDLKNFSSFKFCRSLRVGGCRWVQRLGIVCWTPCFQSQSSCIQQLKGHGTYFVKLPLQLFLRNQQRLNCTKRHEVTTMVSTVQDPICKNVEHLVLHMMKIAPAEIWTDVLVKLFQNLNCSCTNQEKECCY